jgi:hypothetical protein
MLRRLCQCRHQVQDNRSAGAHAGAALFGRLDRKGGVLAVRGTQQLASGCRPVTRRLDRSKRGGKAVQGVNTFD